MDLISIADLERRTKVPRSWLVYELQNGRIPEPFRLNGRRCFTAAEADAIQGRYQEHLAKRASRRAKKEHR